MAGLVPGLERQPLKRQAADEKLLLKLVFRWRDEAIKTGSTIRRIAVAFEAGRDGFWLARWLCAHGIEAYVIHPNSVPVSREKVTMSLVPVMLTTSLLPVISTRSLLFATVTV